MKKRITWTARELLSTHGFHDGDFQGRYWTIVWPPECDVDPNDSVQDESYVRGEVFPPYVLCLVRQLRSAGLQYIVLRGMHSFHNDNVIQSFVADGLHYIVEASPSHAAEWFARLPQPLQQVFESTTVVLEAQSTEH